MEAFSWNLIWNTRDFKSNQKAFWYASLAYNVAARLIEITSRKSSINCRAISSEVLCMQEKKQTRKKREKLSISDEHNS